MFDSVHIRYQKLFICDLWYHFVIKIMHNVYVYVCLYVYEYIIVFKDAVKFNIIKY